MRTGSPGLARPASLVEVLMIGDFCSPNLNRNLRRAKHSWSAFRSKNLVNFGVFDRDYSDFSTESESKISTERWPLSSERFASDSDEQTLMSELNVSKDSAHSTADALEER